jgi:NAD(P)-dependent dehydrogenase (short-subunit alcohol dehydrogenase family)
MAGRVQDKIVVVAGGSRGLGRATSALFAQEGAHVFILARDKAKLDAIATECGERAVPISTDLADPDSVRAAFEEVQLRHGKLDVLFNVAAVGRPIPVEAATDEDVARHVGTNLIGPINTTRAAVPLLRAAGGGDIVNVSSESTLDPMPYLSLYTACKAGLEMYTRIASLELRPENIRVACFVSGTMITEFGREWTPEEATFATPVWDAGGWFKRLTGTAPMDPAHQAETLLFMVTRPREQMIDVMHGRSFVTLPLA